MSEKKPMNQWWFYALLTSLLFFTNCIWTYLYWSSILLYNVYLSSTYNYCSYSTLTFLDFKNTYITFEDAIYIWTFKNSLESQSLILWIIIHVYIINIMTEKRGITWSCFDPNLGLSASRPVRDKILWFIITHLSPNT